MVCQLEDLVSIVVPIYNGEKYAHRCIQSILAQTYINLEVILINDGSTDNTAGICKEFCKVDKRIKYIESVNSGVSAARNKGIDVAEGLFICFVDSDDWVGQNFISELVFDMKLENVDLVDQSFYRVDTCDIGESEGYDESIRVSFEGFGEWGELLLLGHTGPFPKLYKRRIIMENNLRFDVSVSFAEDLIFNLKYAQFCYNGILFSNKANYYYSFTPGSLGSAFQNGHVMLHCNTLNSLFLVLNNDFYKPLVERLDSLPILRVKIIQMIMFFINCINNGSFKESCNALRILNKFNWVYYLRTIKIRNPLRKAFFYFNSHGFVQIAVSIERLRYNIYKIK